jgi:hypothetical protein
MKKLVLILIPLAIAGYFLFAKNDQQSPVEEVDSQPEQQTEQIKDQLELVSGHTDKILKKVLPKETTQTVAYKKFVDANLALNLYLKDDLSAKEGKEFLEQALTKILDCHSNFCGQKEDHEGYFDPAQTVSELSIQKVLEIAHLGHDELSPEEWINDETLLSLVESPNTKTRGLALKHLFSREPVQEKVNMVLSKARDLSGYELADLIKVTKDHLDESSLDALLANIEAINKEKDPHSIIESLKALKGISITASQWELIAEPLCRFKGDKTEEMNWNAIELYMNSIASTSKLSSRLANFCP